MDRSAELYRKWQQCWIETTATTLAIDSGFNRLVKAYSDLDRHYHNLDHIHDVLTTLERLTIVDPLVVSLAAWFHDFIYDPQAPDNERQSAKAARELLTSLDVKIETIDRVERLILATQGHRGKLDDLDLCAFLDADLAILGTAPERYLAYARSIQREYHWVADADYRVGRSRVLESFLQRDRIYYTDLLFHELESIARANMQQEIALLQS